jgi:HTH domain.
MSVNLSVTQQKILRTIAEKQYINATHAAEMLQISRISVNSAISVLKEKGNYIHAVQI